MVTGKQILKVEFLGDEIDRILVANNHLTSQFKSCHQQLKIFPAHFGVAPQEKLKIAIENIKLELQERLKKLKQEKNH